MIITSRIIILEFQVQILKKHLNFFSDILILKIMSKFLMCIKKSSAVGSDLVKKGNLICVYMLF